MKSTLNKKLTKEEIENFGKELEEIRTDILSKVGEEDANYIKDIEMKSRYLNILGRLMIHFSLDPITWGTGVSLLGISKIINNMELGHNVLHGQYDWMNDGYLNSRTFEWDNACEAGHWKFSHNYMHHTYTNIIGKDHDLGYGIMRVTPEQKWRPYNLLQPIVNVGLSLIFEFGVGRHGRDVEYHELHRKQKNKDKKEENANRYTGKKERLAMRDYVLFPALAGPFFPKVFLGNLLANVIRNIWAYSIIFCGHFTENVETFTQKEVENESKAEWYIRQIKGSSNLEGSKTFYMLTGHLSHQIEHHLFPDIPANRYEEIAPRVQAICEKYGQHYNSGSFTKQFAEVWKRIFAFSFPNNIAEKIMAV